jgi:predicted naringenin-chalcone synthase
MTPDGSQDLSLSRFSMQRPAREIAQDRALTWLAAAHVASEGALHSLGDRERDVFAARIQSAMDRCACGPRAIGSRGHALPDIGRTDWEALEIYDVVRHPRGKGASARAEFFRRFVTAYFEREYEHETSAPGDLIHVSCTGYTSPSGAQEVVDSRGWGSLTRVTHAYHMGCYAAFPALRIAAGQLLLPSAFGARAAEPRVDIAHTELCSLHLDPSNHSLAQLVVQSLFADGLIRYSLSCEAVGPRLRVLALAERILPASRDAMSWSLSDTGMLMTLSRDVPELVGAALRDFVADLYRRADLELADELSRTLFAVHPGGPKIIDAVHSRLELSDAQVQISRDVLFCYGNMSSATLPHIWMRILADPSVAPGTLVLSLAFGPGLTICGGLFRKE